MILTAIYSIHTGYRLDIPYNYYGDLNEHHKRPSKMAVSRYVLEDEVDEEVTCSLCFEQYDTETHAPKVLPCQHTFCYLCLVHYEGAVTAHKKGFQCPACKKFARFGDKEIQALPNNLTIISLLGRMGVGGGRRKVLCEEHRRNAENVCLSCSRALCSKCMVSALKQKAHVDHRVVDLEEAFADAETDVSSCDLDSLSAEIAGCESLMSSCSNNYDELSKEVEERAASYVSEVEAWKHAVLIKVEKAEKCHAEVASRVNRLRTREAGLRRSVEEISARLGKKDVDALSQTSQLFNDTEDLITECCQLSNEKVLSLTLSPSTLSLGQITAREVGGDPGKVHCPECGDPDVWRPDGVELVCRTCSHMWAH